MKVEIKNGKAVELNHLDKDSKKCTYPCIIQLCGEVCGAWRKAEAARKVYEIGLFPHPMKPNEWLTPSEFKKYEVDFLYAEGSIHNAELINETTVRLL